MTHQRLLALAVLTIGFATRLFRLDGQSLWGDEAISVSRATESLLSITQTAPHEGTLPPLYYYLLHFWQPMVGTTEFAVRYLSLLFGVLTVAVLYAAVRASSGPRPAVLASLLGQHLPFLGLLQPRDAHVRIGNVLSLASTWLFLRIVQRPQRAATRIRLGCLRADLEPGGLLALFRRFRSIGAERGGRRTAGTGCRDGHSVRAPSAGGSAPGVVSCRSLVGTSDRHPAAPHALGDLCSPEPDASRPELWTAPPFRWRTFPGTSYHLQPGHVRRGILWLLAFLASSWL